MPKSKSTRWYLPTTRNNVIGMVSQGLLTPSAYLPKYFADIQEKADGRLLITRDGTRADWSAVSETDGGDLPALLEIDIEMPASVEIGPGGTVAIIGLVPASRVVAVHFANQVGADEFQARNYDNFRPDQLVTHVSPDLFEREVLPTLEEVTAWLAGLQAPDAPSPQEVVAASSLAGAILTVAALQAWDLDELRGRSSILRALATSSPQSSVPEIVISALTDADSGWLSNDDAEDIQLLRAALTVLAPLAPTTKVGARRVISDVFSEVGVSDADGTGTIESNLRKVRSVLRSDSKLRPFTRESGLRAAKSLLLFLLRPAPQDVVTWATDMPGDPWALTGAATLSGLVAGAHGIPSEMRTPQLDRLAGEVQADRLNRSANSPFPAFMAADPGIDFEDAGQRLTLAGGTLIELTDAPQHGMTDVSSAALVAAVEGYHDLTEPEVIDAVGEFCRTLGWDDVITTVIDGPPEGFTVRNGAIHMRGIPTIRTGVDRSVLLERLSGVLDVPEAETDRLLAALSSPR